MTQDTPTTYRTAPLFAGLLPTTWTAHNGATANRATASHFADVADMCALIPDHRPAGTASEPWTNGQSETQSRDMADAKAMARDGWPEGAERARLLRDGILASMPQAPRLVRYDVAGTVPDVRRALAGNPAAMRRTVPANTAARPVVTLVCPFNAPWKTPAADMEANAAAVAAVVDVLEDAGFRCEVIAMARAIMRTNKAGHETAVRLKGPGDALNLGALAFGLGHPSMLRRLTVALRALDPMVADAVAPSSYGTSVAPRRSEDAPAYVAPPAFGHSHTGTALAFFTAACSALRAQGCPGIPTPEALADVLTRHGAMRNR